MNNIIPSEPEKKGIKKAIDACIKWGGEHQAEIGVVEMALGAGIIYWGVQSGAIHIGTDLVGSKLSEVVGATVASAGGPLAYIAAPLLKSIFVGGVAGVAGVTMLPAIPAILLAGGAAGALGIFGYGATDLVAKFIDKFNEPTLAEYATGAGIILVGVALMIDGARRLIKDERILKSASNFKDGVISLSESSTEIIVKSWEELQNIIAELAKSPGGSATAGGAFVAGGAIGGTIAASSVTVLGSHTLGATALSLGLVSAPVWPIIAGGVAGIALGVAAWKGVKYYKGKPKEPPPPLLPGPDKD